MSGFHFLHPVWLLALPPLLGLATWRLRGRRHGGWSEVVDADLLPLIRLTPDGPAHSPWALLAAVWSLAALALAGPAWQRQESPAFRLPAAWVLALKLSPSMSATDLTPDRISRARYAITDLLAAARDARVALVVYAGEAHTIAPLTSDIATVRMLTQPLSPSLMPESGDQLAPALEEAGNLLARAPGARPQVIVLADSAGDMAAALDAAQALRVRGITVNVVGVGTAAGVPAPDGHGGLQRDATGQLAMTRLDSEALRYIARAGGGKYVPLARLADLTAALAARHTGPLDAAEGTGARLPSWRNEGVWLLPPMLLLAALLARRGWV
jgi:Ca-activated chloride channel family protein